MFPLKRNAKKGPIKTIVKAMTPEELDMRIKRLTDKGWKILKQDTFERKDFTCFKVYHRCERGMGKASPYALIDGSAVGYWCELISPNP